MENKDFNIKNVYHVSSEHFDKFEVKHLPYFFFSNKPIELYQSNITYICNLSLKNPLVFDGSMSWSYPLWLFLSDGDGNLIPEETFTKEKYDGYMGCPYEFWKMVYYDDNEYSIDEIPLLVKKLNIGYDGVIIRNVDEGDTGINVDDYIVFSPEQIEIVRKTGKLTEEDILEMVEKSVRLILKEIKKGGK